MSHHRIERGIITLLLCTITMGAFGVISPSGHNVQARTLPQPHETIALPSLSEIEPNNIVEPTDQANPIGPIKTAAPRAWNQTITGTINNADDLDWYRLELGPASTVAISLTNLPADYDVVLASAANGAPTSEGGLGDIVDLGGNIAAIGGNIAAIGGNIAAIGGNIAAISVRPGTTPEYIETFLWQPGVYYIIVAGHNGTFNKQPYTLQATVNGSGLASPPSAPEVMINISPNPNITTLYILSSKRMRSLYPQDQASIAEIRETISHLADEELGNGVVFDLDTIRSVGNTPPPTIEEIYARWDQPEHKANPLYANYIAQIVDNIITAATIRNPSKSTDSSDVDPAALFQIGDQAPKEDQATQLPPFPNIRHIVIIGDDEVIPFFRTPDLTTIANEADYAVYLKQLDPLGIINPNSAQGAALRYRTIQTDNVYGADTAYNFRGYPLFIPNRAVGRLVETPKDIASYLSAYGPDGLGNRNIDVRSGAGRAFITGYDFLIDEATEIAQTLQSSTAVTPIGITRLINNTWTGADLANAWFDGRLNNAFRDRYVGRSPFALQSVNAHFDHWQTIPATNTTKTFTAQRIYTPTVQQDSMAYFTDRLGYSVGCHSGFNIHDTNIASDPARTNLYKADFAQAFIKQGGNWIGNTGYGYGMLDTINYSERLAVMLTSELRRDVQIHNTYVGKDIGTALVDAKQRYLRNVTSLSAYDAKALSVMTLYGLPFIPVLMPEEYRQPAPPEERANAPAYQVAPITPTAPMGTLERIVTFSFDTDNTTVSRTNSRYPTLKNVKVKDSFVEAGFGHPELAQESIRLFTANQSDRPALPQIAYDLSARSSLTPDQHLVVKDVAFIGGAYETIDDYDPLITQVIAETEAPLIETKIEPAFTAGVGAWYPDKFFDISSVGVGDKQRDQLLVSAAQFKANANGTTGQMRPYKTMTFKITYVDPGASEAPRAIADIIPPQIKSVQFVRNKTQTRVEAIVVDKLSDIDMRSTGVAMVEATYTTDDHTWIHVVFQRAETSAEARWFADIPVEANDLRVIVNASDKAGNSSVYTAKGTFVPPPHTIIRVPFINR